MSRYSAISPLTGRYEDIVCRRRQANEGWYSVFVGKFLIGSAIAGGVSHGGWTAISDVSADSLVGFRMVGGFRTRWDAIEYLLRACGIHKDRRLEEEGSPEPLMTILAADTIKPGEAATVCQVPGTDEFFVRRQKPDDGSTRRSPADVYEYGLQREIERFRERMEFNREFEARQAAAAAEAEAAS